MTTLRLDLHVHSSYSHDGLVTPARLVRRALAVGLDGIAVADHDTAAGALAALDLAVPAGFLVVPAAEYTTDAGHVLGLFWTAPPPVAGIPVDTRGRRPWRPVVEAIREVGGLAVLAHPYRLGPPPVDPAWLDGLEVANGRSGNVAGTNQAALAAWRALVRPTVATAGSDAHLLVEVGRTYRWLEAPADLTAVREALVGGGGWACQPPPPVCSAASGWLSAARGRDWRRLVRSSAKVVRDVWRRPASRADGVL